MRVWYANAAARVPLEVPAMRLRDGVLELSDGGARQALYTAVRHVTVEVLMRWVSGASFDLHAGCLTLAP